MIWRLRASSCRARASVVAAERIYPMTPQQNREKGAAGWAFLVWLFGGGLGLAIVVFIVLKLLGG